MNLELRFCPQVKRRENCLSPLPTCVEDFWSFPGRSGTCKPQILDFVFEIARRLSF